MFQFPAFPPIYLCVQYMVSTHYCRCVPTFGYLWVVGCLHLTIAFRSLPRPSSAPIAKAFTLCSSLLNLWVSIRFSFVEIVYPFFLSDLSLNLFGCYTFLDIFRFSLHYSVFKVLLLVNFPLFFVAAQSLRCSHTSMYAPLRAPSRASNNEKFPSHPAG